MSTYRDHAVVLRIQGLRDHDRHYTVFTKDHGKLVLLAKGLRRIRSKMSPHMATFGVIDIMVARGKIFDRLAGANLVESHIEILNSLERSIIIQAFHLAVDGLTKKDYPEPRIFLLLQEFMQIIESLSESALPSRILVFDAAIFKLFNILGHGFELDVCVSCRKRLLFNNNAINFLRGGIECFGCRSSAALPIFGDTIKVLRFLRNTNLRTVSMLRLDNHIQRQITFLTEVLLTSYLESHFNFLRFINSAILK